MQQAFLNKLKHLLTAEEALVEALKNTQASSQLADGRKQLLAHLCELSTSEDLSLIVATEKVNRPVFPRHQPASH